MVPSILNSIKKVLGLSESDTSFDVDIIMHTNSVFTILAQLGIGPKTGFSIEGPDETWDTFVDLEDSNYHLIKTYMYTQIRLIFDPPATSYALGSMKEQIQEFQWRLNVEREGEEWTEGVRL